MRMRTAFLFFGLLLQAAFCLGGELTQNGKAVTERRQEFSRHGEPQWRIREDGTLLHRGRPFFPVGFYHVTWTANPAQRLAAMKDLAMRGNNCIHVSFLGYAREKNGDEFRAFLDECERRGVFVVMEFGECDPLEVVRKFKGHPAMLGWNPGDEPAAHGIPPKEMFRRYSAFKQEDPDHLVYNVICVPEHYKDYCSGADVMAPDPYPIPSVKVDVAYVRYKQAAAAARKNGTAFWTVPQCFGNFVNGTREPTPQEFRALAYLSVIAGAKGMIHYTYFDGNFFLPKSPALCRAAMAFPQEFMPLTPFLLDGERTVLQEQNRGVYCAAWKWQGRTAYVAVNAADEPKRLELPGDFSRCRLLAEPEGLQVAADASGLSVILPPLERLTILREGFQ
ncbi:MAG: hypothetical protein J6Y80_04035 [Victivallales bacterium]|nr:hypothetical protein [Victivallales bacterium]